jgi:hypothetical protein
MSVCTRRQNFSFYFVRGRDPRHLQWALDASNLYVTRQPAPFVQVFIEVLITYADHNVRQKLSGKRLVGFLPSISVLTKYKGTPRVAIFKRQVLRKALAHVTAQITSAVNSPERGICVTVGNKGEMRHHIFLVSTKVVKYLNVYSFLSNIYAIIFIIHYEPRFQSRLCIPD